MGLNSYPHWLVYISWRHWMHSDMIGIMSRNFRSNSIEKPRKWSYERTFPCRGQSTLVNKQIILYKLLFTSLFHQNVNVFRSSNTKKENCIYI